ncbi:MAG: hypothetical protein AAF206_20530, partial [Bacteroidota bacterium]
MSHPLLFRFTAEVKKVGYGFYLLLVLGLPLGILLLSCAFIAFKSKALIGQPLDLVVSNNVGSWSALLYPLVLLVLVQNLADAEIKNNLLAYAKSFKKTWIDLFLLKVLVGVLILVLITLVNLVCNYGLIQFAGMYMLGDVGEAVLGSSMSFVKMIPAFVPAIAFHLLLCLLLKKSG